MHGVRTGIESQRRSRSGISIRRRWRRFMKSLVTNRSQKFRPGPTTSARMEPGTLPRPGIIFRSMTTKPGRISNGSPRTKEMFSLFLRSSISSCATPTPKHSRLRAPSKRAVQNSPPLSRRRLESGKRSPSTSILQETFTNLSTSGDAMIRAVIRFRSNGLARSIPCTKSGMRSSSNRSI